MEFNGITLIELNARIRPVTLKKLAGSYHAPYCRQVSQGVVSDFEGGLLGLYVRCQHKGFQGGPMPMACMSCKHLLDGSCSLLVDY